jgi:hypothetical protein
MGSCQSSANVASNVKRNKDEKKGQENSGKMFPLDDRESDTAVDYSHEENSRGDKA